MVVKKKGSSGKASLRQKSQNQTCRSLSFAASEKKGWSLAPKSETQGSYYLMVFGQGARGVGPNAAGKGGHARGKSEKANTSISELFEVRKQNKVSAR